MQSQARLAVTVVDTGRPSEERVARAKPGASDSSTQKPSQRVNSDRPSWSGLPLGRAAYSYRDGGEKAQEMGCLHGIVSPSPRFPNKVEDRQAVEPRANGDAGTAR